MKKHLAGIVMAMGLVAAPMTAMAKEPTIDAAALLARLEKLEADNARLKTEVDELRSAHAKEVEVARYAAPPPAAADAPAQAGTEVAARTNLDAAGRSRPVLGTDDVYSAAVLGHVENVNQRRIVQLEARAEGRVNNVVTLSGEVIAIADAHWSNRANKFGYLMRHPTGNNQRTKATQEITINSAQLGFTFAPAKDVTGYVEMLYDPEQSFGSGTLTTLARNQVQVRKAYVMWGNLNKSPVYVSAGKMDIAFGLQDSVSPFTNSSNWHAFAPLAFAGEVGYYDKGLSLRATAIGGGAQFRSANTPVDGTAIPSKLNNFAFDGSYKYSFGDGNSMMLGGSYIHGSAYCQAYPITHFTACNTRVPAWAAYGRLQLGKLELLGDFAKTSKVWPGTQVPNPANPLAVYPASKVTSFTAGGRYTFGDDNSNLKLSLEYSKFIAGPQDSPWHRQDQTVLGLSRQFSPGLSLFGELINVAGYSPLNFISGGNFPDGSTWSDASARSQVVMTGVRAGF